MQCWSYEIDIILFAQYRFQYGYTSSNLCFLFFDIHISQIWKQCNYSENQHHKSNYNLGERLYYYSYISGKQNKSRIFAITINYVHYFTLNFCNRILCKQQHTRNVQPCNNNVFLIIMHACYIATISLYISQFCFRIFRSRTNIFNVPILSLTRFHIRFVNSNTTNLYSRNTLLRIFSNC